MQKAISNQMTRNELEEFLSDPSSKKEFFELMKLKSGIERIAYHPLEEVSIRSKKRIFEFRNPFLAAACIFVLSALAIYFMFFRFHSEEFIVSKSVITGDCSFSMNRSGKEIFFKSGKNSFCDYKVEGDLGLTLRLLPNSEFYVSENENEANLNLDYGTVLFTTHKNRPSLRIRSRVKNLSSELLGTTLVLIGEDSSKLYKILVLDGAIRIGASDSQVSNNNSEVQSGFEAMKNESSQNQTESVSGKTSTKIEISKIEPNTFKKYDLLSENSKEILNANASGVKHDEKTISILRKETSDGISEILPIYKIILKNGKTVQGTVEENDRLYILTNAEGNKIEIDKKEIEELELIPPGI